MPSSSISTSPTPTPARSGRARGSARSRVCVERPRPTSTVVARVARADRVQQRLGLLAEQRDAGRAPPRSRRAPRPRSRTSSAVGGSSSSGAPSRRAARPRARRSGRSAPAACRSRPGRARGTRRRPCRSGAPRARGGAPASARIWPIGAASGGQPASRADRADLLEHLEQPVAGGVRAQVHVERGDEAGRQVVLGRAHGDARRERRDRLVADVLVDEVRGLPEPVDVDARCRARARASASASDSPETRWSVSASG